MKKLQVQRYFAFWLYTIFALVVPVILVLERFNFFSDPKPKSLGMGAIIILCLIVFYFRHHIGQWFDGIPDCALKHICKAIKELSPLLVAYGVFAFLKIQFINVEFIMKWSCISNFIALGIRVWHLNTIGKITELKESESE